MSARQEDGCVVAAVCVTPPPECAPPPPCPTTTTTEAPPTTVVETTTTTAPTKPAVVQLARTGANAQTLSALTVIAMVFLVVGCALVATAKRVTR